MVPGRGQPHDGPPGPSRRLPARLAALSPQAQGGLRALWPASGKGVGCAQHGDGRLGGMNDLMGPAMVGRGCVPHALVIEG